MFTFPRPFEVLPSGCIACYKMQPRGRVIVDPPTLHFGKYGLKYEGENWGAPRLSFHLNKSPIARHPEYVTDQFVLHTCDNEWCINSDHLYLGTISQNTKDKFERHPTIRKILSEGTKKAWMNRSPEARAASLDSLNPHYERSDESRQKSAESRRRNWAALTPEQYSERCRKISEGKRR